MLSLGSGQRVLVVEDDDDLRFTLLDLLSEFGYDAVGACNGAEALRALRETPEQPRLIVLDIMMPVMDGREFRNHQLSDPELSSIPVLVLTANANAAEEASRMRATAHLTKPVGIETLLAAVARFCHSGTTD